MTHKRRNVSHGFGIDQQRNCVVKFYFYKIIFWVYDTTTVTFSVHQGKTEWKFILHLVNFAKEIIIIIHD